MGLAYLGSLELFAFSFCCVCLSKGLETLTDQRLLLGAAMLMLLDILYNMKFLVPRMGVKAVKVTNVLIALIVITRILNVIGFAIPAVILGVFGIFFGIFFAGPLTIALLVVIAIIMLVCSPALLLAFFNM